MLVKGTIGLGIRERKPVTSPERYSNKTIGEFVNTLPKANIGETSRRVYKLLHESNQLLLSVEQRNQLVDAVSDTANYITDAMQKHYAIMSVALSEKQQKIANFSQALEIEIAIAYKTIVEDLIVDEKFTGTLLTRSINACLHYFYKVQTRCYQLYRDLPSSMWHEIHLLYQLAEQNQLHEQKINYANQSMSILATYKNILLLATINPNQLRQHEISQIAASLGKASHQTSLDADPSAPHDFIVNLKSDSGPFHNSLMNGEMQAHYRGISLTKVVEILEQELQHKSKDNRLMKLDDSTQKHLLTAWGTMTTRTFARVDGEGKLTVTVGLTASNYLISETLYGEDDNMEDLSGEELIDSLEGSLKDAVVLGGIEDDGMITQPAQRVKSKSTPRPSSARMQESSMWDAMYRNRSAQSTADDSKPFQFMEGSKEKQTTIYNTQLATIINISPGGFCLEIDSPLPKQTQTGEIIGLLEHVSDEVFHWNIGTIRWMRRKSSGELEIGVQLIAPNALPIKAQLRTSHSDDNLYQRCLKLPAIESIGQPETLLTSPLPFREQAKVRILTQDGTDDVLLLNEINSGHSFKQFIFQYLETDLGADMKDNTEDFDSVWKLM